MRKTDWIIRHFFEGSNDFHLELASCDCEIAREYRKEFNLPEPSEEELKELREFRESEKARISIHGSRIY